MATSAPHAHGPQKGGALSGLSGGTADATLSAERISPDFLVVVLDLNPEAWQKNRPGTSGADATFTQLEQVLNAVLVFLNAQTAMQHGNGLAVYGAVAGTAQLLYTTAPFVPHRKQPLKESSLSMSFPFKHIDDAVFSGVRDMMREACTAESLDHPKTVGIVRALALALCHINRLTALSKLGEGQSELDTSDAGHKRQRNQAASTAFRYRILVLSATPDTSSQYVPMMNCIFSAQKQSIHIDVCRLFGDDTVFLRQACHLTGGHYYRLDAQDGLLQVLMTVYLPSRSIRPWLMSPAMDDVDFRAACFCHRRNVDIGYVCSVCLSIFCAPRKDCMICHSEFPSASFQRFEDEKAVGAMLRMR